MFSFSWAIGSGDNCKGGMRHKVTLNQVIAMLEEIAQKSGAVTLDIINGSEIGPQNLQVQTEKGYFIIFLGEDDGEDYNVRTYTNYSADSKQVDILGQIWDLGLVCTDFDIVKKIFREFIERGDVSEDLLS
ncbi:DUF6911 family protein [Lusitaniella coriacea]|uniref:DUF6911 family protein n=1 Tax=Lusitaniella coriacea TaxID=1983105 RepID=UPI003CF5D4AB